MIDITIYASGSTGNCYTVEDEKTTVMLDCGLPFHRIHNLMNFKLPTAVFITHEHQDHAKAVRDFIKHGIDVYMSAGTCAALQIAATHRLHIIEMSETVQIGTLSVTAFDVQHDAHEPLGFIVEDNDDRVLYATDTYYLKYQFPNVSKMMIEANHSYAILNENVKSGRLTKLLRDRLVISHFSLENVLKFLQSNDLSKLKEIWLIHLSQDNADPAVFKQAIEAATGVPAYIAQTKKEVKHYGRTSHDVKDRY